MSFEAELGGPRIQVDTAPQPFTNMMSSSGTSLGRTSVASARGWRLVPRMGAHPADGGVRPTRRAVDSEGGIALLDVDARQAVP